MLPADQMGLPSIGAAPGIVNPNKRRWSGNVAVRTSALWPKKNGLSIFTAQSISRRRGVESSSVSMPTITWPFSSRNPKSACKPWGLIPRSRPAAISARHSSTDWSTAWCSSNEASPVKLSRMTWQAMPATSVWRCCKNFGGSARPTRCSSSPASGPVTLMAASDIVRSRMCTCIAQVSAQSRNHISAFAAPPDVKVSTKRVSVSRQIMPSSMRWPRSLSSST